MRCEFTGGGGFGVLGGEGKMENRRRGVLYYIFYILIIIYKIYYYQYITRNSFMFFGENEGGVVNSQIGVKGSEKSGSDGQNQGVRCSKVGCKL